MARRRVSRCLGRSWVQWWRRKCGSISKDVGSVNQTLEFLLEAVHDEAMKEHNGRLVTTMPDLGLGDHVSPMIST